MAKKLAAVTGASSDIGLSLAKELAARGYDLVVCAEDDRLKSAVAAIQGKAVQVIPVQADLAKREGVDQLWSSIEATGRFLDIAGINAAVGVGGLFRDTDLDAELNMVSLNCAGTVQLAKYVTRTMEGRGSGQILFTASIAGEMVAPREAVYAATKAFVLSFAHSLRYELRHTGVTVTALQPGPTDTDFFHRAGMDDTEVGSEGNRRASPTTLHARESKLSWREKITFTPLP